MTLRPIPYMISLALFAVSTWLFSAASYGFESEYAGKSPDEIKTFSPGELKKLLNGDGSAFVKAAEVNDYPSPQLVLSMAKELKLTKKQLADTQTLYEQTKTKAIQLGRTLVNKERELELAFFSGSVNPTYLKQLVDEISTITASLRYLHLKSYYDQLRLLDNDQIFRLDQLASPTNSEKQNEPHDH